MTQQMSFSETPQNFDDHRNWLVKKLKANESSIYVALNSGIKIGTIRFEHSIDMAMAEVSININPEYRGHGLSKIVLEKAILDHFSLKEKKYDLIAKVKHQNIQSIKIFSGLGFHKIGANDLFVTLAKFPLITMIRPISIKDSAWLYKLLTQRRYVISHLDNPKYEDHIQFVEHNPYKYWFCLDFCGDPLGSFYIQEDNSIGINLRAPNLFNTGISIDYIKKYVKPEPEIISKRPKTFYVNVPISDNHLKDLLVSLGFSPIQTAFSL